MYKNIPVTVPIELFIFKRNATIIPILSINVVFRNFHAFTLASRDNHEELGEWKTLALF